MANKYTYPEEEQPQMACEDIAASLNNLRSRSEVKPYTIEELNSRIDEAEQQMSCGEIVSGEQVHAHMRNLINNL